MSHDKILVGEVPDPQVGVWRQVTNTSRERLSHSTDLQTWYAHLVFKNNEVEERESGSGFYALWAKKLA